MKKRILTLALIVSSGLLAHAQERTVTGNVVDDKGQPVIAAVINTADGKASTQTDADGNFSIIIPEGASSTLEVDIFGFPKKSVTAQGNKPLSISMGSATSSKLDGVIITGYGVISKEKSVGAADNLTAEQIAKFPVTDVTKAIEGAAPGIQVTNGGGAPGSSASVRIRGIGSLSASSAPLYVVDGAPYLGDITAINPNDIENLSILKDATATSLYGARGANGVIVITTKRGKNGINGKPQITLDIKGGMVMQGLPRYDIMTSEKDFYELTWESYRNSLVNNGTFNPTDAGRVASGLEPSEQGIIAGLGGYNSYDVADDQLIDPVTGKLIGNPKLKYHDDWQDELTRLGGRQDYNLSVSGRNDKTDYYFSAGYLKEDGYVKYSDFDRFNARMNINTDLNDYIKFGLNVSGSYFRTNFVTSGGTAGGYNPFFAARTNAPIYPVYYRNAEGNKEADPLLDGADKLDWGAKNLYPNSSISTRATLPNANVLGSLMLDQDRSKTISVVAVPYVEIKFLKDFKFLSRLSANYIAQSSTNYNNPFYGQFAIQGGAVTKGSSDALIYTFQQQLSYSKLIGKHSIDVLLAHENYYLNTTEQSASSTGLAFPGNSNLTGAATTGSSGSQEDNHRLESYIANARYDYENTYFLSASIRSDGSSRFAPATRWGSPFWAVGAAVDLKKAEFMRDVDFVTRLKPKVSYGTNGNENLSSYYASKRTYSINYPNGNNAGAVVASLGNDRLTWESAKKFNAGIEFGLTKSGRITGEVNYFVTTNADLLYNLPLPLSQGVTSRIANTATVQNRGIEVTLGGDIVRKEGFTWNVSTNFTHYKNEVTKMPVGLDSILGGNYQLIKGRSRYEFYLVESGINNETGAEIYYYNVYDSATQQYKRTFDSVYATANGLGRTYQGSSLPDVIGSFTNNFSYKGFDFSFLFSYGIGGKYYDGIYAGLMQPGSFGENWHNDMLGRWTPENKNSTIPRLEQNSQDIGGASTRWLVDASYFNLRNINLGYTLPTKWTDKAKLQRVRIYAAVDNVFLLSKRKGMDPQANYDGSTDYIYNPARTIMFGLNIGL